MARKNLIKSTENLLLALHEKAEGDAGMDLASQLKLVAASTAFLAARAKLVPDEPAESGLAMLRDELMGEDKPRKNGKVVPLKPVEPEKPEVFANY